MVQGYVNDGVAEYGMTETLITIEQAESAQIIIEQEGDTPDIAIELEPEAQAIEVIQAGTPGPIGPPGIQGPPGDQYPHDQPVADTVWEIPHNLGYWPLVQAWDRFGARIRPGIENVDLYLLRLHFTYAQAGSALCK